MDRRACKCVLYSISVLDVPRAEGLTVMFEKHHTIEHVYAYVRRLIGDGWFVLETRFNGTTQTPPRNDRISSYALDHDCRKPDIVFYYRELPFGVTNEKFVDRDEERVDPLSKKCDYDEPDMITRNKLIDRDNLSTRVIHVIPKKTIASVLYNGSYRPVASHKINPTVGDVYDQCAKFSETPCFLLSHNNQFVTDMGRLLSTFRHANFTIKTSGRVNVSFRGAIMSFQVQFFDPIKILYAHITKMLGHDKFDLYHGEKNCYGLKHFAIGVENLNGYTIQLSDEMESYTDSVLLQIAKTQI